MQGQSADGARRERTPRQESQPSTPKPGETRRRQVRETLCTVKDGSTFWARAATLFLFTLAARGLAGAWWSRYTCTVMLQTPWQTHSYIGGSGAAGARHAETLQHLLCNARVNVGLYKLTLLTTNGALLHLESSTACLYSACMYVFLELLDLFTEWRRVRQVYVARARRSHARH